MERIAMKFLYVIEQNLLLNKKMALQTESSVITDRNSCLLLFSRNHYNHVQFLNN